MNGMTLFSSSGIGEYYLSDIGIDIVASNELIPRRAELHRRLYQDSNMVCGDIRDSSVQLELAEFKVDIVIASPPCQGISIAGLHRNNKLRLKDERNYLVLNSINIIKKVKPRYILFENVSGFGKMHLPYKGGLKTVEDILVAEFGDKYSMESEILDCAEFGIPQFRKRNIIKLSLKEERWEWPSRQDPISVEAAIGHLPSIESGEYSEIPWHFGRKHQERQVEWMKHTPTGCSAFDNPRFFPKKLNGERIKGYNTTYKRMRWDTPAPTITMRNDAMSSQANVHPGRKMKNGLYSDARVLSLHELFILNSLPADFSPPEETSEILLRQVMGECIPPLLIKKIFQGI